MALSYIDSTTSTASTVTASNSIQRGDLLVLMQRGIGAAVADVTPTGFTNIGSATLSTTDLVSAKYKIASGQENGATITGINAATNNRKILLVFRGSGPLTAVTPADYAGEITDGNPAAQTINASGQSTPLVALAFYSVTGVGASVDPRTFTVGGSEASDGELNITTHTYCKYKIYNSSPADISADMDDEGTSNTLQSFYITCTEGSFNSGLDFLASRQEEVGGADADTPVPAVRANGDLLVCLEAARDSANIPTDSTPSLWTKIGTASNATAATRTSAFYKISDGTESAVGALSADTYTKRQVLVFRRFDGAINSVTAAGYTGQVTNANPTAQTIASVSGTAPLVAISMAASTTAVDPLSFTVSGSDVADRIIGTIGTDTIVSKHKIYASSPASITTDMDDEGTANALQSFYLEPKIPVTTTKTFTATVTPTAAFSKLSTRLKTFTATVTPTASFSKISVRPKSFTATVTPSASLSRVATRLKSFTATVTPGASFSRLATRLKSFTATVTPSVTLSKPATRLKSFTATVTPTATFTRAHVIPIGLASETDSALSTTQRRSYAAGLASETDSSFAVGSLHLYALGLAQESDVAFDVSIDMGVAFGTAYETDSALSVTASKVKNVGQGQESDSAFAVTVFALKIIHVGQAVETDEGFAVLGIKGVMVSQAQETDTAFPLQGLKYSRRLFFVGRGPEEKRRVPNEFHIFKPNPN